MIDIAILSVISIYLNGCSFRRNVNFEYDNGDTYEGQVKRGKKDGEGKLTYNKDESQYNGFGTAFDLNGNKFYEGNWKDGLPNGEGTYFNENGKEIYTGNFLNGNQNGFGTTYDDNEKKIYEGNWLNNQRNGFGTLFVDGEKLYEGYWLNDKKNGKGASFLYGKKVSEGNWLNGKKNGIFTYYYDNGEISGRQKWKNGKKASEKEF